MDMAAAQLQSTDGMRKAEQDRVMSKTRATVESFEPGLEAGIDLNQDALNVGPFVPRFACFPAVVKTLTSSETGSVAAAHAACLTAA